MLVNKAKLIPHVNNILYKVLITGEDCGRDGKTAVVGSGIDDRIWLVGFYVYKYIQI